MKINVINLTYYIGLFMFPACLILCLLEFIWYLNKDKKDFYFINSLKWFIHQETPQEVIRALSIIIISIICTIAVILIFTVPAQAGEWSSVYSQKVESHQNVSVSNITIPDIQFSAPVTGHINSKGILVLDYPVTTATISFNVIVNNAIIPVILGEGETYTDNKNEFQIAASGFTASDSILWEYANYNPSVTLSINTWHQDLSSLKINIIPQYSSIQYGKYQEINIAADITNTGKTSITVDISPDFGSLSSLGNTTKQHIIINPDNTQSLNWNINIPPQYGNHTISVLATIQDTIITYPDGTHTNKTMSFSSSTEIQITSPSTDVSIQKIIPERLYTCVNTSVILIISNNGIFDIKNITVTDRIPNTFAASKDIFIWNIPEIKSKMQYSLFEKMTPTKEGSYTIEGAEIKYIAQQTFTNISNTVKTQVISTGKTCSEASVQIVNVSPEPIVVNVQPVEIIPTSIPTPTIPQQKVITITPSISIPGFNILFGIIALFAAYNSLKQKLH